MKQTVVEWLVDEMNSIKGSSTNMNGKIQFLEKELNKLYEQAKEMEKERVIDFAKKFSDFNGLTFNEKEVSKEYLEKLYDEYYNETFKSE